MNQPPPELSRPLPVDRIRADGLEQRVEADAGEREALALRLNVPALEALTCVFHLAPLPGGVIVADGKLDARVLQTCVITLEEFESSVAERFSVHFVPEGTLSEASPDPDSPDEIPYDGRTIDLGETAAEQLALALDPYPRKPGVTLPAEAHDADANPFSALARLHRPGH